MHALVAGSIVMLETRRDVIALITELLDQLDQSLDEAETRRDLAERLLAFDAEDVVLPPRGTATPPKPHQ